MRVLVAGATGFVARLLVPELLAAGHDVIGLSRNPPKRADALEVRRGDVSTGAGVREALQRVELAYYLVHSFEDSNQEGFAQRDRRAAERFGAEARTAGVQRIVYCGVSPASAAAPVTQHRRSRNEVGDILRAAVPDSVCLRTWTILSPENQFIQFLVFLLRRRSAIFLPPSSRYRFRPIDGRDLARALAAAGASPAVAGQVLDVAGSEMLNTQQLVERLSEKLSLKRRVVTLPFTPPAIALKPLIRAAALDTTLILSALASARVGDVLPADNSLPRLVQSTHRLDDSLAYAASIAAE